MTEESGRSVSRRRRPRVVMAVTTFAALAIAGATAWTLMDHGPEHQDAAVESSSGTEVSGGGPQESPGEGGRSDAGSSQSPSQEEAAMGDREDAPMRRTSSDPGPQVSSVPVGPPMDVEPEDAKETVKSASRDEFSSAQVRDINRGIADVESRTAEVQEKSLTAIQAFDDAEEDKQLGELKTSSQGESKGGR